MRNSSEKKKLLTTKTALFFEEISALTLSDKCQQQLSAIQ